MVVPIYITSEKHRERLATWRRVTGDKRWTMRRIKRICRALPDDLDANIAFVLDTHNETVRSKGTEGRHLVLIVRGFPHTICYTNKPTERKLGVQHVTWL